MDDHVIATDSPSKGRKRHRAPEGGSRAYEYGCLPPTCGADEAIAQMRGRNSLWNALAEISHRTDREKESYLAAVDPMAVRPSKEWLDQASGAEKKGRAALRKAIFRHPDVEPKLDALKDRIACEVKAVSKQYGLIWTNYGDVIENWTKARQPSIDPETGRRRGGDDLIAFHRFDGSGKTVQRWQFGLPLADLAADTRAQLDPIDPRAFSENRAERRKFNHTTLRLRVGSDDRKPVWCEVLIYLHRPLPDGCRVQRVELIRERVGTRFRWKAIFVVRLAEPLPPAAPSRRPVAVEIGWRRLTDGLRVAVWTDGTTCHHVELGGTWDKHDEATADPNETHPKVTTMTESRIRTENWIGAYVKSDDLQSIRSKRFNVVVADLLTFLRSHDVPTWFRERTKNLATWKSQARLAALVRDWRRQRFDGDVDIFEQLEGAWKPKNGRWNPMTREYNSWRAKDKHLLEWQIGERDKTLRRRREMYCVLAAWLAKQFDTVVVERFNLSNVAQVKRSKGQSKDAPKPDGADLSEEARHQRVMAATSTLRLALKNAFEREHGLGAYVEVDAAESTRECFWCGTVDRFDAATNLRHVCSGCRREWDQDENAARVLLKRFSTPKQEPGAV